MIIFTLDGELLYSLDYESEDIKKILTKWRDDNYSDEPWLDDDDWKLEYYSVKHFLEWYKDFHSPFTGHLDRIDFPEFHFVDIIEINLQSMGGSSP